MKLYKTGFIKVLQFDPTINTVAGNDKCAVYTNVVSRNGTKSSSFPFTLSLPNRTHIT
jgi:hypothetical protein